MTRIKLPSVEEVMDKTGLSEDGARSRILQYKKDKDYSKMMRKNQRTGYVTLSNGLKVDVFDIMSAKKCVKSCAGKYMTKYRNGLITEKRVARANRRSK